MRTGIFKDSNGMEIMHFKSGMKSLIEGATQRKYIIINLHRFEVLGDDQRSVSKNKKDDCIDVLH